VKPTTQLKNICCPPALHHLPPTRCQALYHQPSARLMMMHNKCWQIEPHRCGNIQCSLLWTGCRGIKNGEAESVRIQSWCCWWHRHCAYTSCELWSWWPEEHTWHHCRPRLGQDQYITAVKTRVLNGRCLRNEFTNSTSVFSNS